MKIAKIEKGETPAAWLQDCNGLIESVLDPDSDEPLECWTLLDFKYSGETEEEIEYRIEYILRFGSFAKASWAMCELQKRHKHQLHPSVQLEAYCMSSGAPASMHIYLLRFYFYEPKGL